MNTDDPQAHEDAVSAFMRQAVENDPELVAAVCRRHVVLNEHALRYRRGREVPMSPEQANFHLHAGLNGKRIDA